jgi:nucleoside-diphosphate-sugar epimerase
MSDNAARHALIVGASGTIGRPVVERLVRSDGWSVRALTRRADAWPDGVEVVHADLLKPLDDVTLEQMSTTTHLVFAAYQDVADLAGLVGPNVRLLENALEAVKASGAPLEHVTLYQGGKYYGAHIGPFKTPAREDDPRIPGPNFYYDQEDLLRGRADIDGYSFTIFRPEAVCSTATGNPLNLLMVIAVYASICKELGIPMRFPGNAGAYTSLYQVTDGDMLARATEWGASEPRAKNEAFNIANGDHLRWQHIWPELAGYFDVDPGTAHHLVLSNHMAGYDELWSRMVSSYGLQDIPYTSLVNWSFGDFIWGNEYDNVFNMNKLRHAGFHEHVDTEQMFFRQFDRLRTEKLIP